MDTQEYAIEVSDLKIRYKCLNKVSIRQSLFSLKKSEIEVYEAVRGVSFKVPRGEIMGIVGKNGMYSKLAFSITAILETEIMLIDEVLSVGDARFKAKSYEKMKQLITNEDRTVIIVSHSTETLERLCDTILWLHEGKVKMQGSTAEVLPLYNDFMSED